MLDLVQYEFAFPNEYTDILAEGIGKVMDIKIDLFTKKPGKHIEDYESEDELLRLMRSTKDAGCFILVQFSKRDWIYSIVVRCRRDLRSGIEEVLKDVSNSIGEEYGEDRSKDIRDVTNDKDTLLKKFVERYNFTV